MRKKIGFYKDLHLILMKAIVFSALFIFCSVAHSATVEYGNFFTYHIIAAEGYNKTPDKHTTFNPNLRVSVENVAITLLQDSIGDLNVGVIYRLPLNKVPVKLILGGYTINPRSWQEKGFKKVWLDLPNGLGFIPVLGPGIELELFKKENFKIKVEGFASAGLFVTGGLTFGWDF